MPASRTHAPLLFAAASTPMLTSSRIASLTGIALPPNSSANRASMIRSPGTSTPAPIRSSNARRNTSRQEVGPLEACAVAMGGSDRITHFIFS